MKRRKSRRTARRGKFSTKRPIGVIKSGGKYHLVYPKLGRGFKTKKGLAKHYAKTVRRRR